MLDFNLLSIKTIQTRHVDIKDSQVFLFSLFYRFLTIHGHKLNIFSSFKISTKPSSFGLIIYMRIFDTPKCSTNFKGKKESISFSSTIRTTLEETVLILILSKPLKRKISDQLRLCSIGNKELTYLNQNFDDNSFNFPASFYQVLYKRGQLALISLAGVA